MHAFLYARASDMWISFDRATVRATTSELLLIAMNAETDVLGLKIDSVDVI